METYDYEVQISTNEGMPEWIHETIGQSFNVTYRHISMCEAMGKIERLKEAGFDIYYVHRRVHTAYKDVT